jgi:hypothetical protein
MAQYEPCPTWGSHILAISDTVATSLPPLIKVVHIQGPKGFYLPRLVHLENVKIDRRSLQAIQHSLDRANKFRLNLPTLQPTPF